MKEHRRKSTKKVREFKFMIRRCELQVDKVWKFVFEASFSWPSQRPIHPFCFVSKLNGAFDNYSLSKRLFLWNSAPNFMEKISRYSWNIHRTESGYNFFNRNGFCLIQFIGFTFFFAFRKKKVFPFSAAYPNTILSQLFQQLEFFK